MPLEYEDMDGLNGDYDNPGGTDQEVYYASKSEFETIQPEPAYGSGTELGDDLVIAETHVMKEGKKLKRLIILQDSGQSMGEMIGELGGKSVGTKFDCTYVGELKKMLGMQNKMKNDQFLFFIPLPDGNIIQVGTKTRPASAEAGFDTAKAAEGVRALKVSVSSVARSMWLYTGDLPLIEAVP